MAFDDVTLLLSKLRFRHQRTAGSHHIYAHPAVPSVVSIQSVRGHAKPYQLRQLVRLIRQYNLALEDGP